MQQDAEREKTQVKVKALYLNFQFSFFQILGTLESNSKIISSFFSKKEFWAKSKPKVAGL